MMLLQRLHFDINLHIEHIGKRHGKQCEDFIFDKEMAFNVQSCDKHLKSRFTQQISSDFTVCIVERTNEGTPECPTQTPRSKKYVFYCTKGHVDPENMCEARHIII